MEKYLVACSGGVDSVVLAHYLASQNKLKGLVHYKYLDPTNENFLISAQNVVFKLKELLNTKLFLGFGYENDVDKNKEKMWRNARYSYFSEVYKEEKCKIAIAHHLDDQLASYTLSLVKNSDRCFIKPLTVVNDTPIIRPFLLDKKDWYKKDIYKYFNLHNLEFAEDPENMNPCGDRCNAEIANFYLKKIPQFLPLFKKKYKTFLEKQNLNFDY